jgi:hypothetical protein
MSRTAVRLGLLHLVSVALLLWLAYEWLGVGESSAPRLMWSAVDALAILALACWLYGATFLHFRAGGPKTVNESFRVVLRRLPLMMAAAILALVLYGLLAWWESYSPQTAAKVAAWLTLHLRKPVKPAAVLRVLRAALWMVRWALLPAELLPLASGVAALGWRGFREFGWRRHARLYRLAVPLLLLAGLWIPFRLLDWRPRMSGFQMEMASFALRMGAAYLLFVGAGLVLAFLTSRGRPVASQPITVASP